MNGRGQHCWPNNAPVILMPRDGGGNRNKWSIRCLQVKFIFFSRCQCGKKFSFFFYSLPESAIKARDFICVIRQLLTKKKKKKQYLGDGLGQMPLLSYRHHFFLLISFIQSRFFLNIVWSGILLLTNRLNNSFIVHSRL